MSVIDVFELKGSDKKYLNVVMDNNGYHLEESNYPSIDSYIDTVDLAKLYMVVPSGVDYVLDKAGDVSVYIKLKVPRGNEFEVIRDRVHLYINGVATFSFTDMGHKNGGSFKHITFMYRDCTLLSDRMLYAMLGSRDLRLRFYKYILVYDNGRAVSLYDAVSSRGGWA